MEESRIKTYCNIFMFLPAVIILLLLSSDKVLGQVTLTKVGKFKTGMSYGLSIKNNYAYITTNTSLFILDIKNPEKPVKSSELVIGTPIFGLSVRNNLVFLAASDKGLVIVDISDPNTPTIIGEYSGGGTMANVELDSNYCYTMTYEKGIEIIDISKPAEPKRIGGFQMNARDLSVRDNLAYVSDPINGLTILDISNPKDIIKLSVVDSTEGAAHIITKKDVLFLGSYGYWLKVFDISEPHSPSFIKQFIYPYEVSGFIISDNYLITNFQGIIIEDISDFKNPIAFVNYHAKGIKGMAHGIAVENGFIYFVKKGMTVLKFDKN